MWARWECYRLVSKILFCCLVPHMFNLCKKVVKNPHISARHGKEGQKERESTLGLKLQVAKMQDCHLVVI